jgi:hypothetical protein
MLRYLFDEFRFVLRMKLGGAEPIAHRGAPIA